MTRIARRLETENGAVPSWSQVFIAASLDKPYWDREVREPAVDYIARGKKTSSLTTTAEDSIADQIGGGGMEPSNEGGGRKHRKRARSPKSPKVQPRKDPKQPKKEPKQERGDKGGHPRKMKDGRCLTTTEGREICFRFNNKGGCSSPCAMKRLHICQWCLKEECAAFKCTARKKQ